MAANTHRKVAGILYIVHGLICLVAAGFVASMLWRLFSMALEGGSREENLGVFIGAGAIVLSSVLYILQIFAGIIILRRETGAKGWGIAGAVFGIPSGIFGIVIAAYGLWVFLSGRTSVESPE